MVMATVLLELCRGLRQNMEHKRLFTCVMCAPVTIGPIRDVRPVVPVRRLANRPVPAGHSSCWTCGPGIRPCMFDGPMPCSGTGWLGRCAVFLQRGGDRKAATVATVSVNHERDRDTITTQLLPLRNQFQCVNRTGGPWYANTKESTSAELNPRLTP